MLTVEEEGPAVLQARVRQETGVHMAHLMVMFLG
jgi:hypothetical protein